MTESDDINQIEIKMLGFSRKLARHLRYIYVAVTYAQD